MLLTDPKILQKCMDDHNLHMETLNNARELGGYVMKDGSRIRRGLLIRSTALNQASPEDLRRLSEEYHVACVIDMRGEGETVDQPDPAIPGAKWVHAPIINPNGMSGWGAQMQAHRSPEQMANLFPQDLFPEGCDPEELQRDPKKGEEFFKKAVSRDPMILVRLVAQAAEQGADYTDSYATYLADDYGREGIRIFFRSIIDTGEGAVLWHCFTGKDRTGIGAALLLAVLGAEWDTILMDYEVSNLYFAREINGIIAGLKAEGYSKYAIDQTTGVISGIHPDMLVKAWKYMQEHYGSADGFLREAIGLTDADDRILKDRYLEENRL